MRPLLIYHELYPFSDKMSLRTMSIGTRAAIFNVTRMGWSNLGVGMAKFGPNWSKFELPAPK